MSCSIDYFRDEIRNRFYIPGAVKQAWVAELQILEQIDRICRENNITYFADWGTMLGCVRHGGFVPWDDDLDICMKREDYTRFKELAPNLLPKEYTIHDYMTKDNHWLFLSRVVNNEHICFEPEHLEKNFNFPYLAGIDIFVLDYVYADSEQEKKRCDEVLNLIAIADSCVGGTISSAVKEQKLIAVEQQYNTKIDRQLDSVGIARQLYHLAELQMARTTREEAGTMVQLFPWGLRGITGLAKEVYDETVRLPFEYTDIPVVADYHDILAGKYGNYLLPKMNVAGHDYPYFEKQRKGLMEVADFKLPEFSFSKDMLRKSEKEESGRETVQATIREAIAELNNIHTSGIENVQAGALEDAMEILPQCQDLAVGIGNYIEEMLCNIDASFDKCIEALEAYCEKLFELYSNIQGAGEAKLAIDVTGRLLSEFVDSFVRVKEVIEAYIINRRLVLFLPDNPVRWGQADRLYRYYARQEDTLVLVVPMPVFRKNPYGEIVADEYELSHNAKSDEYPKDIAITEWDQIDISLYEFATVCVQNQYDNENGYLTIPGMYYSAVVREYTEELIYLLDDADVDEFELDNDACMYGLRARLHMPAAVYSDKILCLRANMIDRYVACLTDFAGETYRDVFDKKVMSVEEYMGCDGESEDGSMHAIHDKRILFCVGRNEFATDVEAGIRRLAARVNIFDRADALKKTVLFYPNNIDCWNMDRENIDRIRKLTEGFEILKYDGVLSNADISDYDGYYGSPSPLVPQFRESKKPIMISEKIEYDT